jgi:hypothetical protein
MRAAATTDVKSGSGLQRLHFTNAELLHGFFSFLKFCETKLASCRMPSSEDPREAVSPLWFGRVLKLS